MFTGGPCNAPGTVELAGPIPGEGRVVLCDGGLRRDVCSFTWSDTAAVVVCRQLGLATGGTCDY